MGKSERATLLTRLADAYSRTVRIYLGIAGAYYAAMLVAHVLTRSGLELVLLTVLSGSAVAIAACGYLAIRTTPGFHRLEIVGSVMHLAIFANVWGTLQLGFDPNKLSYFMVMVVVFGGTSVSFRQAGLSIAFATAGLFIQISQHAPELGGTYGYIVVGTAAAAIGLAALMRSQIRRSVQLGMNAEAMAREFAELARTDSLTGLGNRRALLADANAIVATGKRAVFVLIDVDAFKAINDSHGHAVGDALLIAVAEALSGAGAASVARIGGDEFALLLTDAASLADPEALATGLSRQLSRTYQVGRHQIRASASLGFTYLDGDGVDACLERADYALHHSKKRTKGRATAFSADVKEQFERQSRVIQALRTAPLDVEMNVLFQPLLDTRSGRVVGAEALARWNNSVLGSVPPAQFIRAAEDAAMMSALTPVLFRKALEASDGWPNDVVISFNLSAQDISSAEVIASLLDMVEKSSRRAPTIEFEVTETVMMADFDHAARQLQLLASAGHPIAIDDFGAGYSNFGYLPRLPITKLKVDRSLLAGIASDERARQVLATIVQMAQGLGLDCVIEGVETNTELAALKRLGASIIQGYVVARPMDATALAQMFDTPAIPMRA